MKSSLAYVDDDKNNLDCVKLFFENDFSIKTFWGVEEFIKCFETESFDGLLFDIHMPIMNGFQLYQFVISHPKYNGCPIFFYSSDNSNPTRLHSLDIGAVDFISRSTKPDELIARIKSRMSYFKDYKRVIELSNLRLNFTALKTYLGSNEIALTFIEFKILGLLLNKFPNSLNKEELIENVWGKDIVLDATIYTHISHLNKKLMDWDYEITGLKISGLRLVKKE